MDDDRQLREIHERQCYEQERRWLTEDPAYFEFLKIYEEELNKWESSLATKAEPISSQFRQERMSESV